MRWTPSRSLKKIVRLVSVVSSSARQGLTDKSHPRCAQNGYDVDLLALKPRNSALRPDSLAVEADDPFGDADERSPLAHPTSPFLSSDRPSSTRSSKFRPSLNVIPPVSNTVPRFAAAAYQHRAQASESRSSLAKYRSGTTMPSEADEEKGGWSYDGRRAMGKKLLWQRKWLLLAVALALLFVCVGVGAGVGVMMGGKKHAASPDKDAAVAAESSASPFTNAPHPATSSPGLSPSPPIDWTATPATGPVGSPTEAAWDQAPMSSPTLSPQGSASSADEGAWTASDTWNSEADAGWARRRL